MVGTETKSVDEPIVFVDALTLADRLLTGIGRYTARLSIALQQVAPGRVRFFDGREEILAPRSLDWGHDQDLACWARAVWRGRRRTLVVPDRPGASVAVYPCVRPPSRAFPHEVSILHDFTTQLLPWTHTVGTRSAFIRFFTRAVLASDRVVAVSSSTRSDARWLCDVDPERIIVAPSGPSLCVDRHLSTRRVRRRPEVGLVVSTLEPRKNAYFLLDWFQATAALPADAELWWVGPRGWLLSEDRLRASRRGRRRVRFLGMVSDRALCRLYSTAGWTAYPSLYEGFGFPVLDALRHGTPVLAAYHSALSQFDHPGVFHFDPYEPATVDEAWHAMLDAGGLAAVADGAELDRRYSWRSVAQAVLGVTPAQVHASRAA